MHPPRSLQIGSNDHRTPAAVGELPGANPESDSVNSPKSVPIASVVSSGGSQEAALPLYDRETLTTGVVHFGVGGFHRAHQAMFIDRLLRAGVDGNWAITGVGVLPADKRMRDVLESQDHLYALTLKYEDGTRGTRVIGSIRDYLYAPDDPEAVVRLLASPEVGIVSLTITEGGYNTSDVDGRFLADSPAIAADLVPDAAPTTVFGLVTEGLRRRREAGIPPFTVMSCDNILGNGHVAKNAFVAFASLRDAELGSWMREAVAFPNSMVDRITPVTTQSDVDELTERTGIEDAWPVVCEPFVQWVLEDRFTAGRPDLGSVGVQLVGDVAPYELMKLRLLNGSHQAMAYFGTLLGHEFVHEALADQLIRRLLLAYMHEVRPSIPPVLGVDLDEYCAQLLERFSNPAIRDTLARLAADTSDRIPKWMLPIARGSEVVDAPILAAIVASWARYAEGINETGQLISVVDRNATERHAAAARWPEDDLAFIRNIHLFDRLAEDTRFTGHYRRALSVLHSSGAKVALGIILDEAAAS